MNKKIQITKKELRLIFIIGMISTLRMLGIFMILPILSVYAMFLKGANEYLIGISIGIYGVIQIFFQLPFGYISDKIGRKPIIILGLILSALGSEISAMSDGIWGLIIGRALQGTGAIGSVLIALLLDSVQERYQTQSMAVLGISFGITFISSMILGPFIASKLGLNGIFQIITIITGISIILALLEIPWNPSVNNINNNNTTFIDTLNNIKFIITHSKILKLNFNIFCLHFILTLNFIIWPHIIISLGYPNSIHFKIYAIIMIISILITFPYIFLSNKKNYNQKILSTAKNTLFLSELIMLVTIQNRWLFFFGIQLFFISFNLMESILPALIGNKAPTQYKGSTLSIYSICQFLGIGLGGIIGGFLFKIQGIQLILLCATLITLINIKIK